MEPMTSPVQDLVQRLRAYAETQQKVLEILRDIAAAYQHVEGSPHADAVLADPSLDATRHAETTKDPSGGSSDDDSPAALGHVVAVLPEAEASDESSIEAAEVQPGPLATTSPPPVEVCPGLPVDQVACDPERDPDSIFRQLTGLDDSDSFEADCEVERNPDFIFRLLTRLEDSDCLAAPVVDACAEAVVDKVDIEPGRSTDSVSLLLPTLDDLDCSLAPVEVCTDAVVDDDSCEVSALDDEDCSRVPVAVTTTNAGFSHLSEGSHAVVRLRSSRNYNYFADLERTISELPKE
jgi:hypothetical protein